MPVNSLCEVIENKKLNDNTYAISVKCGELAASACAGQFVHIKCGEALLLRRPFGICSVNGDAMMFVYEIKGKGTRFLSSVLPGQTLDILGPLGNGFSLPEGDILIAGGSAGAAPLLFAAASAEGCVTAVLGFRDSGRVILKDEFEAVCDRVYITTDDGSFGIHGTVAGPVAEKLSEGAYSTVLACGNSAMLRAVARLCEQHGVPCQVSMEERMACGVGACLVCACATVKDGVPRMSRVCKDGPVFDAGEIKWD